ncbi:MAG: hypothetical protein COY39_04215 [Alphaproteobacteria bacterium CG_4_10_14_0_8_um_filter_37_21]|nr:MAG: hypothetical protein COY39_04215 [Alphaproteobacteria bacterium CG_4_10_14_0_8_um_filter_37_21]
MSIPSLYLKVTFCLSVLVTAAFAQKQTLILNDDKVLKALVSKEGITRISLQGDRIADVMGFHQDVEFEKDEGKGVLFIKGLKQKQNLVMNTENGLFQELELVPSDKSSAQIVLKANEGASSKQSGQGDMFEHNQSLNPSQRLSLECETDQTGSAAYHQAPLHLIKTLYNGGGEKQDGMSDLMKLPKIKNLTITYQKSVIESGFMGHQLTVKNTRDTPISLSESYFRTCGGPLPLVALSLKDKVLLPKSQTQLYVVVKNG